MHIYEYMTTEAINTGINSMLHNIFRLMEWLVKSFHFDSNNKGTGTARRMIPYTRKQASESMTAGHRPIIMIIKLKARFDVSDQRHCRDN